MRKARITLAFASFAAFCLVGYAQSLGDVAREQRQKQASKPAVQRKVVTDEDMPAHSKEATDLPDSTAKIYSDDKPSPTPLNSSANAEQVKASFLAQKQKIADFQKQLDDLRASIYYVEANRYTNGVQYNQAQQRKQQEADRMQKKLDEVKKNLESQQENARKAGFGSAIYDP
jgi:hypothetical protein